MTWEGECVRTWVGKCEMMIRERRMAGERLLERVDDVKEMNRGLRLHILEDRLDFWAIVSKT